MSTADKAKLMTEAEKTKFNQAINQNSDPKKVPASKAALANEKIGLRRGELIALKWKNVDFENETVNIDHGECQYFQRDENGKRTGTTLYEISDPKTEKSKRCIPLTKETIKILQEIKDEQMENGWYSDDQFVVYNGVDYKSRANHYSYIMKYMCQEADIRNIPNHLLRKTFATNLSTSGVAENVIIDILGHTSYQTTSDYYILDTEIKDKRSQIQKAEDAKAI